MTFEEALEIAIDKLESHAVTLLALAKSNEKNKQFFEPQYHQANEAICVLKKELDGMQAQVGE